MMNIIRMLLRNFKYILKQKYNILLLQKKCTYAFISHRTTVCFSDISEISIGNNVYVGDYTVLSIVNDAYANRKNSNLVIGDNTYIGEFNNIRASGGRIEIGRNCLISQHITIVASNHSFRRDKNINMQPWSLTNNYVIIGDDVWIGAGSVILPGVHIGTGAIVSAGSIVKENIPSNAIVSGNPARIIKYRN